VPVLPLVLGLVAVLGAGTAGFLLAGDDSDEPAPARPRAADLAQARVLRERAAGVRLAASELERLGVGRAAQRRRLARARSRRAQAAAAAQLADTYARTARRLGAADRGGATAELSAALRRAGLAYGRLARAGRRGSAAGWSRAGRQVRRRESDLRRAVAALKQG
jgi:hypothetical protein